MKSKFFYGALAVLSLAACSQDEVVDVNRNGDEIAFSVVTNKATRATALYDNSTLPTTMKVWGNLNSDGTSYFAGDDVTIASNGTCTSTNTRYWPDVALDFFAVAGRSTNDLTVSRGTGETATSASFTYTVKNNVNEQEDVLYAAALNKTKPAANSTEKVTLNFAHALSQIVFKAKNSNPKLYVVVSGVKVAHLNNQGIFTFTQSTGTEWSEDETGNFTANNTRATGSWGTPLSGDATYEITCTSDVELTSTAKDLESTDEAKKADAMLLMPQSQDAWYAPENGDASGFYFGLKCRIYNVANAEDGYQDSDIQLWGAKDADDKFTKEEAYVYIPASIDWKPGKKYIYTFNFGNGNGGFEPNPEDPDTPNPDQPVLIPIEYTVTVDDFDIVGQNEDLTVNGKNGETN